MTIDRVLDTPWKAWNEFWRLVSYPYIRLIFSAHHIEWGPGWKIYGAPIIQKHRQSQMNFGEALSLRSSIRSNPLGPNRPVILCTWEPGACLEVGDHFAMTGGSLVAADSIRIGDRVAIGANSTVIDTDFHPVDPQIRRIAPDQGDKSPVVIEDDVFIGMNCLILKGVTIGAGSLVGAGSVVVESIPAGVIAAGNPARVIRSIVK